MDTPPSLPPPGPSPQTIRRLGWLSAVIGVLLSAAMVIISWHMIDVVNAPVAPGRSPTWTGSQEFTARMFWLFGGVFLFGLVSLANGVWQVQRGSMQPVLRGLLLVVGLALFVGAYLVSNTPK